MANPFDNPDIYIDGNSSSVNANISSLLSKQYDPGWKNTMGINTGIANTPLKESDETLEQELKNIRNAPGISEAQKKSAEDEARKRFEKRRVEEAYNANKQAEVSTEASKLIEAAKGQAKAAGAQQQTQPTDWISQMNKMEDSAIKFAGVDPEKYREAVKAAKEKAGKLYEEIAKGVDDFLFSTKNDDKILMNFNATELSSVLGLPYQWMEVADNRLDGSSYGRKFHEKILSKMPLMVLTPGIPDFMAGYGKEKQDGIIKSLITGFENAIKDLTNEGGDEMRYYTLQFEAEQYYSYVDSMCTALAVFLGINNAPYLDTTIGDMKWMSKNAIAHRYSYYGGIGLYLNSETQISENFGNETARSILADTVNSMSDVGREIQFLTGISGFDYDILNTKQINKDGDVANDWIKKAKPGTFSGFMGMLINGGKTIFAGGKLEFPELWADSSYSSSYSINIKLISPDYDSKSWFLNIGVPLMHLIAMCSPRQVHANGYISPFLVRAFYRGFFNIDMGLMSMSVQKGSEGGWTIDGLPTTVDITLEIKDLYSKFSISSEKILGVNATNTFGNVGLITYLANMAGVNTNEPDIIRTARLFTALKSQSALAIPSRIATRINNSVANILTNRVFKQG